MCLKFIVSTIAVLSFFNTSSFAQQPSGTLEKIKDSSAITIGHRGIVRAIFLLR